MSDYSQHSRSLRDGFSGVDKVLLEPYAYIDKIPGKEIRPKLIEAFNVWLQVPPERVEAVKEIVQKLHNASLLIDDIEDNSRFRRGVPAAHKIYGEAQTINAGNFVYFLAMQQTLALGAPGAVNVFVEELLRLHRGQGYDIYWRDTLTCPTEEEYSAMVIDKTGGLFRLAVGLMQQFSSFRTDLTPLVNCLAKFFQILDDLLNLQSDTYFHNKSFCEDLTEGKFSFPIIHCVRSDLTDHRLINILKQRTEDVDMKKFALSVLERAGSFEYTRRVLRTLLDELRTRIAALGGNAALEAIVTALADSGGLLSAAPPRSAAV